jgi:hypothetical protein
LASNSPAAGAAPWAFGKAAARPVHGPPAAAPAPAPGPSCHVVSYFDADGNKHFKQECR